MRAPRRSRSGPALPAHSDSALRDPPRSVGHVGRCPSAPATGKVGVPPSFLSSSCLPFRTSSPSSPPLSPAHSGYSPTGQFAAPWVSSFAAVDARGES